MRVSEMRIKVRVIRGGLQTSAASGLTSNESGASAAQKLASFNQTEEAFQDPGADRPPPPLVCRCQPVCCPDAGKDTDGKVVRRK